MKKMKLGRTKLEISQTGFGGLPIQRVASPEAERILRAAFDAGIDFYDTARMYTDSEEKFGRAFEGAAREKIFLATKSMARTGKDLMSDIELSLTLLKTDYVDVYQSHFCKVLPLPNDGTDVYETFVKAREQGKIKFFGVTTHDVNIALECARSGLYDTVQYPISCLSVKRDLDLIPLCKENNVGLIAMKAMSGGLLKNTRAAFAFMAQFDNIVPIWGVQTMRELDEWIGYSNVPPALDAKMLGEIEDEKKTLGSSFCRGCGYCMPCPVGIEIPTSARMALFLQRMPVELYTTPEWKEKMALIDKCVHCDSCKKKCPYELDTPALLAENLKFFKEFTK